MSLGCWNKQHRQVLYKGVDITDKIGLCICDQCTESIRSEIDALLKAKELAAITANTTQAEICAKCDPNKKWADWQLLQYTHCPYCGRKLSAVR